ncbi:LUC7-domain-containing protein [Rhizodiscina lignyota]|uniref:LUC7-domain-containing protein n=1 Tax=Rhizodiscina lignyota TaxID=1504668 RepID=A0A9P4IFI5_9PEZI|nr:LUC7-domain-containing protein [Rhizodiscina lignyota]
MAAEQRKLLEQLMGEQLMSGPGTRTPQLSITDPKVCRSYLVGTCPRDLFTNTKQDNGPCPKVHNEALKNEYEAADEQQKRRWGFEYDYFRDMTAYVDDCNRRIDTAERRLESTADEIKKKSVLVKQISNAKENITAGLQEVEVLAKLGHVNLAVSEHFKVMLYQQEKDKLERQLKDLSDTSGPSGHQKLQVCDVCGAYLSRLDNDRRLADHFYGKMHLGYAQMRKTYEQLQKELQGRPPPARQDEYNPAGREMAGGYGDRGHYGRGNYGGAGGYGRGRGGGYRGRGGYGGGRW